ncbi:MAG: SDR family oxidoreductase, partial [Bacteriovoracaceae bacterium]|nr:SDR family oxidoreductase [Bacteriovoracaceae bacterium]
MTKRTLIVGASGLLGSSLTPYLQEKGYEVLTHSKSSSTDYVGDLSDSSFTSSMLNDSKPDFVINLVALTNVDYCEKYSQEAYLVNAKSVENLVQNLNEKSHLIQISTDQIYNTEGVNREESLSFCNSYSFTKYIGELYASQFSNTTILRTNFFGPSKCKKHRSFSDWLIANFRAENSINLFDDIYFSPLFLNTICKVIEMTMIKGIFGTFNVGSRDGMTKKAFAYEIAKKLNLSLENTEISNSTLGNLLAKRPLHMIMDSSKFEKTYDFKLPTLLEEILN